MILGENAREKRHPGEPVQGETPDQTCVQQGDGKGISLGRAIENVARTRLGIHRAGRVCGGDAEEPCVYAEGTRPRTNARQARNEIRFTA